MKSWWNKGHDLFVHREHSGRQSKWCNAVHVKLQNSAVSVVRKKGFNGFGLRTIIIADTILLSLARDFWLVPISKVSRTRESSSY